MFLSAGVFGQASVLQTKWMLRWLEVTLPTAGTLVPLFVTVVNNGYTDTLVH